jgi:hypothetical protein
MKLGVAGTPWTARFCVLSRARMLEYERSLRPCLALAQDAPATAHHSEMGSESDYEAEFEQEAVARELAEELRKLRVEDVLVNTLVHVSSIGYRRLGLTEDSREERDLPQTALAIETMQALVPVLEDFLPNELVTSFEEQIANLQLAYAKAAKDGGDAES